jgi:hypothetical protein
LIYERYLKECSWALGLRMNRFVNESGAAESAFTLLSAAVSPTSLH